MLKKADLRKLRALNATQGMITRSRDNKGRKKMNCFREKNKYRHFWFLRAACLNGYIKVAAFRFDQLEKGIRTPMYEIFLDPEQKEYISRRLDKDGKEGKWSKATIGSLLEREFSYSLWGTSDQFCWDTREARKTVSDRLGKKGSVFRAVMNWQQSILDEKRIRKQEEECRDWDQDMKLVPDLPAGFLPWMKKEAIKERYIFYEYSKNVTEGWCSYCGKLVDLSRQKPRHNAGAKCPRCRKKITYKALGKMGSIQTDYYPVRITQRAGDGLVVRKFCIRALFSPRTYRNPNYIIDEYKRFLCTSKRRRDYLYREYKSLGQRWCYDPPCTGCYSSSLGYRAREYLPGRVKKMAQRMSGYTSLDLAMEAKGKLDIVNFLKEESLHPEYEKLLKAGFTAMFLSLLPGYWEPSLVDRKATSLTGMLQLDKMRLARLRKMSGNVYHLKWLQEEKREDTIYDDVMILNMGNNMIDPDDLKFLEKRMSYRQVWNYLRKQYLITGATWNDTLTTWRDYLRMAEGEGMRVEKEQIFKPANLKAAHDALVLARMQDSINAQVKDTEKKFKGIRKIFPGLKKYEFSGEGYRIVAPSSTEDIIREGISLHHCVHTCDYYWQRMLNRETYILFLRREESPDTSYYTLEVEPSGNIRQKRTTGDRQDKDFKDAEAFLAKWQAEIQERLTAEDIKLGKKSDALRRIELKELREKGNRVWHGKLQGQLLADVLEGDFMPAIPAGKEELLAAAT